ncbi:thioredoxin domain-containing protein [Candidatus Arsenophonus triatominarum]|uniref:thioredoxin domain-containing protein n=1 Tax=Candidatus Arsenophonus triatominarum TaxID=57911 RepID=UPI0007C4B0B8|nr:thioredoxin domain-containing protein [Candidatus Arsenophonus triatominarum]
MKRYLTIGLLLGSAFLLPIISQAEELTGLENLKMLGEYYDSDKGDITPVVNPAGKVRVMVFYQYQCADCAKMAPMILKLAKSHPDIRFVFKNLPDNSKQSLLAAQAELMIWLNGGEAAFLDYYADLFSGMSVEESVRKNGFPLLDKESELRGFQNANAKLAKTTEFFAEQFNIQTLPTLIIASAEKPVAQNNSILTGMVDEKTLLAAVEKAKRGE